MEVWKSLDPKIMGTVWVEWTALISFLNSSSSFGAVNESAVGDLCRAAAI